MSRLGVGEHALTEVTEREFFSEEALKGVHQLNRALIELLVAAASRPASQADPPLSAPWSSELVSLGHTAREHLACCPLALVDFGFRDIEWWRLIERGRTLPATPHPASSGFPRLQAIHLAQMTLTLAWTGVHASPEAAAIVFGLAPECASTLAGVGIQAIPHIAEAYIHGLHPRWETDGTFWHGLIRVAQAMDSPAHLRLPPLGVYVMQRQFADLLLPTSRLATGDTASTRADQR